MRFIRTAALALIAAAVSPAQMPVEQKIADFVQLASLYAKNYAPYEWKVAQGFDLYELRPWLDRVRRTNTDLEFMDLCVEYVASLNDAHDNIAFPSAFRATLPLAVDIYGGKVLIEGILRTELPADRYPFQVGDELVSIDGKNVEDLIRQFMKYSVAANERSTRRAAAAALVSRAQTVMPFAHEVGETASVVIRRQGGEEQSYEMRWTKFGTPVTSVGPVPGLRMAAPRQPSVPEGEEESPVWMKGLELLTNVRLDAERFQTISGMGARTPIFRLPANFQQRLGRLPSDVFYSGTFDASGLRIGFVRIPNYSQSSSVPPYAPNAAAQPLPFAVKQFEDEMIWMQANTDGLIIDDMRNPGGNACYVEDLLRRVMPSRFRTLGFEVRATAAWVATFDQFLGFARQFGAPQYVINLYGAILKDLKTAYSENRGRTGALSLCNVSLDLEPARDANGAVIAYRKPLIVLADEFSASGGDMFPAIIQDNGRGLIVGMRTMGAGGSVVSWDATNWTEGFTRVTVSLMNRKDTVVTNDLPAAPYVENIGVRPDVQIDYMTRDNLLTGGRPFMDEVTGVIVDHIRRNP